MAIGFEWKRYIDETAGNWINQCLDRYGGERFRRFFKDVRSADGNQGHRTLHPDDQRPRRPGVGPHLRRGTTAYVAEQWGRRWITIDTSRVALALARARIMGARYPYYLLTDSPEGQRKEAEIRRRELPDAPTYGDLRQGFVYERVPHITLRDIANNAEIDVIWETLPADAGTVAGTAQ